MYQYKAKKFYKEVAFSTGT